MSVSAATDDLIARRHPRGRQTLTVGSTTAEIRLLSGEVVLLDADDASIFDTHYIHLFKRRSSPSVLVECRQTGIRGRLARLIMNAPSGLVVDHINGNALDNRRMNLRICSVAKNNSNRAKSHGTSSIYKGVSRKAGGWVANISGGPGKLTYLGYFRDETLAAEAYDRAARKLFGEWAALNFPRENERSGLRPRSIDLCSALGEASAGGALSQCPHNPSGDDADGRAAARSFHPVHEEA